MICFRNSRVKEGGGGGTGIYGVRYLKFIDVSCLLICNTLTLAKLLNV